MLLAFTHFLSKELEAVAAKLLIKAWGVIGNGSLATERGIPCDFGRLHMDSRSVF